MINIVYKTVKPSHLKKLQTIQNIKNLMFQVIFIFSDWILIKQILVFFTPFWGKQIFEIPGGISNFLLPGVWWQELVGEWAWASGKMPRINAFSRNVSFINWKIFLHMVECKILKKNSASILDRDKARGSLYKYETMYPWG